MTRKLCMLLSHIHVPLMLQTFNYIHFICVIELEKKSAQLLLQHTYWGKLKHKLIPRFKHALLNAELLCSCINHLILFLPGNINRYFTDFLINLSAEYILFRFSFTIWSVIQVKNSIKPAETDKYSFVTSFWWWKLYKRITFENKIYDEINYDV